MEKIASYLASILKRQLHIHVLNFTIIKHSWLFFIHFFQVQYYKILHNLPHYICHTSAWHVPNNVEHYFGTNCSLALTFSHQLTASNFIQSWVKGMLNANGNRDGSMNFCLFPRHQTLMYKGPFINGDLGSQQIRGMNASNFSIRPYANRGKSTNTPKICPLQQQVTRNWHLPVTLKIYENYV